MSTKENQTDVKLVKHVKLVFIHEFIHQSLVQDVKQYLLDIRTVVTNLLLDHLKSAGTKWYRFHFLPTVTFPRAGRGPSHRLVAYYLRNGNN